MCGQSNDELTKLCYFHEIDISNYTGTQRKDKIAQNLVDYEVGKTILDTAMGIMRNANKEQTSLF
jgi:DNA (cytosine-5)-methyltransferase 1